MLNQLLSINLTFYDFLNSRKEKRRQKGIIWYNLYASTMGCIIKYTFNQMLDYYKWVESFADPRTANFFLVRSIINILILELLYLLMVWIGPKIMYNRQPFKFKRTLIIYSFSMALFNCYIALQSLSAGFNLKYNIFCEVPKIFDHPYEHQLATASWLYFFSKLVEFLDTLIFILRKKTKQLSFLHIYHHSSMLFVTWVFVKWMPTGSAYVGYFLNSSVHVIMYTYYGLSAFGPQIAKYLWWKQYVTIIQLIQFVIAWSMTLNGLMISCGYPLFIAWGMFFYTTSYIVLFSQFYINEYRLKTAKNDIYEVTTKQGEIEKCIIDETYEIVEKNGKKSI